MLPAALERLIAELSRLPGIGRRSAERIALDLLAHAPQRPEALATALRSLAAEVGRCERCHYFSENGVCPFCDNTARRRETLYVVETATDAIAFDKAGGGRGLFHILGGRLSPLRGVSPGDLHIAALFQRLKDHPEIEEVVLATSPSVEGEATAIFLAREIAPSGIRLSRIGRGVPMGGALEQTDPETLRLSLEGRRPVDLS